jgi:protein O-mannosyl-transferase
MLKRHWIYSIASILIAVLATILYLPFLGNGLVFDDLNIFQSSVFDYAQSVSLSSRSFPNFTLGIVHVLSDRSIPANRIFSLLVHILCALMLFALIASLLRQVLTTEAGNNESKVDPNIAAGIAFVIAAWFAVNPVAVYGAGYLAQRTILFATLFSLLCLWFFRRAFLENRTSDVITAALFYCAAVYSKEHAILLPLAVVILSFFHSAPPKLLIKRIGIFWLLCLPAALHVLTGSKTVIASSYEPDAAALLAQLSDIPLMNYWWGKWLISMLMQGSLFFDYLWYWLIPDIRTMSVDMRIDFHSVWSIPVIGKALIFAVGCPALSIYCLRRRGLAGLFGFGLLYCWLLFFTEFAAIRIQEPFVLYRSHLWAPGFALMLAAILGFAAQQGIARKHSSPSGGAASATIALRWILALCIPVIALNIWLARERLATFKDSGALWKDAAAKLSYETILGSDRIFYNRGLEYLKEKKYIEAAADFSYAISKNPNQYLIYIQRARAYFSLRDLENSLADINRSLALNKDDAGSWYFRGLVLEQRGCISQAKEAYALSLKLGLIVAKLKLEQLESLSSGKQKKIWQPCDYPTLGNFSEQFFSGGIRLQIGARVSKALIPSTTLAAKTDREVT